MNCCTGIAKSVAMVRELIWRDDGDGGWLLSRMGEWQEESAARFEDLSIQRCWIWMGESQGTKCGEMSVLIAVQLYSAAFCLLSDLAMVAGYRRFRYSTVCQVCDCDTALPLPLPLPLVDEGT